MLAKVFPFALLFQGLIFSTSLAQEYPNEMVEGKYTDFGINLTFTTWSSPYGFTFGLALSDKTGYTGLIRCQSSTNKSERKGWCGLSHGPSMLQNLLLVLWPSSSSSTSSHQNTIQTSFRQATDYFMPEPYPSSQSPPSIQKLSEWVNSTGFELIYQCQGCILSGIDDDTESNTTTTLNLGYAMSFDAPVTNNGEIIELGFHDEAYGTWDALL
ncbi:hypothetical protein QBC35DRAFT_459504 [Podospora australis]|uniref:Cellobiose dehydrogenase-like cytochrome domain-containing protein n=1 Tax=Podospora australis TaxID=1536484 RepID=A0AAN7AN80_9PEZI|nr:hypothetical protein QBC35DRAFT_459504 [Podospora australis]